MLYNMDKKKLLRQIPAVDRLLQSLKGFERIPQTILTQELRNYLAELRKNILHDQLVKEVARDEIVYDQVIASLKSRLSALSATSIAKALNATGVILHTGLGRAVLPPQAIEDICRNLRGYATLEVDRDTGERGQRDQAVRDLLCRLTNAEDATIVNNNAAAVLLALAALARGKEVIVSRGQLVEIGGSFRVPEIMSESGATLVEVGCTNKTHLVDYEKALSNNTVAILQVHSSNFKILGFTHEVALADLAQLAHDRNIYLWQDAGSGAIKPELLPAWAGSEEPIIAESIAYGADLVTFSGDKLLGSCQAGLIVGKQALVQKIRKHPLARALRSDKVTLSIIATTLKHYMEESSDCLSHIPTLAMLNATADQIKVRAERIAGVWCGRMTNCKIAVVPSIAKAGSGAFPIQEIPSYSVQISSRSVDISVLAKLLRLNNPAVFGRVHANNLFLDPRTLLQEEDIELIKILIDVYVRYQESYQTKPD